MLLSVARRRLRAACRRARSSPQKARNEPSGRVGSGEHLHPARGIRKVGQAGDPLVARQGQQRRPVAGPQGVLRSRAVSGDARRHRDEVPGDVRLPGPLRQGMEPQLHPRAVPAEGVDRPEPAAGRPLGRAQDPGPEGRGRQARLQRPDPGHPPRRGGDPRQGALFQPARRGQQLEPQGPAARVLEPVHDQLPGRHACAGASAAALDRGRHLEIHQAREHPDHRSLLRQERQALPVLGDHDITSPIASHAATLDEIIAELETTRVPERSGRAMDHESEDAFERLRAAGYM